MDPCIHGASALCRKARSDARRAQAEADALKQEAAELRERADQLLKNLRAAEDDVSALIAFFVLRHAVGFWLVS